MKDYWRIYENEIKPGTCRSCPCVFTEESEISQNYGCLPDHHTIISDYLENKGHWKCHSAKRRCGGLQQIIERENLPERNRTLLITEDNR